jgi:hypothetical protein
VSTHPTRSELEDELTRTREALAAARGDRGREDRDSSGARTAIAVAIITGIFAFGPPIITQDEPVVTNCMAQRSEAIDLVRETGVWTELPEDSTSEQVCAINEYVVEWQQQNELDDSVDGL